VPGVALANPFVSFVSFCSNFFVSPASVTPGIAPLRADQFRWRLKMWTMEDSWRAWSHPGQPLCVLRVLLFKFSSFLERA